MSAKMIAPLPRLINLPVNAVPVRLGECLEADSALCDGPQNTQPDFDA